MKEKECHMFIIFEETRKGLDLLKKILRRFLLKKEIKKFITQ